jgi:N-carbamoylputrescine amidase
MSFRAALTQTCNAYGPMPTEIDGMAALESKLEDLRQANIDHHVGLLERASQAGAALVGLGELFSAPYFALHRHPVWRGLAEPAADGPTVSAMRAAARRLKLVLVVPIYERAGQARFNTAVVIDADGALLGGYRKCHIPRGRNEAGAFDETYYYGAADGTAIPGLPRPTGDPFFPVFESAACRIGVNICYDRHFEGVVAALARGGAQVIFSPAVTFGAKSRRMWDLEFQVDAARWRVIIGGSNRQGAEPPWNQEFFGASHFVGPEGRIADLSQDPRLVIAEIDLERLAGPDPAGWDLARDRRPELY